VAKHGQAGGKHPPGHDRTLTYAPVHSLLCNAFVGVWVGLLGYMVPGLGWDCLREVGPVCKLFRPYHMTPACAQRQGDGATERQSIGIAQG
jgi:hypothetical protein